MKNKQVLELYQEIKNNKDINNLKGIKLSLLLLDNVEIIESFIKKLQESIKADSDYEAYENERVKLCEDNAEKDESGQPLTKKNGQYTEYVIDQNDEFNAKMNNLNLEYAEVIDKHNKKIDEYNLYLDEETTVELKKIDTALLPEDVSFKVINILKPLLN